MSKKQSNPPPPCGPGDRPKPPPPPPPRKWAVVMDASPSHSHFIGCEIERVQLSGQIDVCKCVMIKKIEGKK